MPDQLTSAQQADPEGFLRLIACPHLLSIEKDRLDVLRPAGGTVTDLMRSIAWTPDGLSARVYLDGELVRDAAWEYTVPQAGQSLVVRAVLRGGDGGGGKDALRIVAMIGIIAASIFTAGAAGPALGGLLGVSAATGSAIAGAAVSIVGTLAVNALIPPARPKLNDLSGLGNASNTLALTGTSNQLIPYGVVPRVYGRHRMFPPHAARPYSEVIGSDQYLRAVFCFGRGPLALSDFKIGETPVELFQDVQIEVRQGYPSDPPFTLYPAAINEETLSVPITFANGGAIRASQAKATELSIDVTFFEGLWTFHAQAGANPATVQVQVEYRKQGETLWIIANGNAAVLASVTTDLPGAHNDLVLTAVPPIPTAADLTIPPQAAYGNNLAVAFVDTGETGERLTAMQNGPYAFIFVVNVYQSGGYWTAAEVKAFLDVAAFVILDPAQGSIVAQGRVSDYLTVALAPGSDGTGQVQPMDPLYLRGGINASPSMTVTDRRTSLFRTALHWPVPEEGIYEVQVTRVTPDETGFPDVDLLVHDKFYWTSLRTIRGHVDVMPKGMAGVALRIKATDQLNGTIDSFNAMAESILPDWTGAAWVARPTSNPASIFRDLHQGTANARPKPDSQMDLATLKGFHARCAAHNFSFHAIIDFRSTVAEIARDVLAAGRATPGYRDGKVSLVEDIPQSLPVTILTPRNSWGWKGTKVFVDLPHALKVRFANKTTLQQDEQIVLADGYGYTGLDGVRRDAFGNPTTLPEATKFESVEAGLGVNDPQQIFKLQRYHLAVLALRSETYRLSCDFEHLVMTRGDLVMVQHDLPLFGLLSARITGVTLDGIGRTTAITVDEPCVMQAGERYGVQIRLRDGSRIQREVQNVPGAQTTLTLLEPI